MKSSPTTTEDTKILKAFRIQKSLAEEINRFAEAENRNFSNMVIHILSNYVRNANNTSQAT